MGVGLPELIIISLIIPGFIFTVWMLIAAAKKPKEDYLDDNKTAWVVGMVLAFLFFPFGLPASIYFYVKVYKATPPPSIEAPAES